MAPHVVVIGAGPQALTVCTYLLHAVPGLEGSLDVLDPAGWLSSWHRQFAALDIDVLRSACVHHSHPDPYALLDFANTHGRSSEMNDELRRPSTPLFADFCTSEVVRLELEDVRRPVRATSLRMRPDGRVQVSTCLGDVHADHVVLATNPTRSLLPEWAIDPLSKGGASRGLLHSDHVDLSRDMHVGERVLVVGGGLTACQLALGATRRGARVTLAARRCLKERPLDVEAAWLGGNLVQFHAQSDPARRRAMVREARGGGTVPAQVRSQVRRFARTGRLDLRETTHIGSVRARRGHWRVGVGPTERDFDRVWMATGHDLDWRAEPLLAQLAVAYPVDSVHGLPVLERSLRWPGTAVHLTGGLAALSIGPAARNIAGARMAAERIRDHIAGVPGRHQYPQP